jgi:hypothetical protein
VRDLPAEKVLEVISVFSGSQICNDLLHCIGMATFFDALQVGCLDCYCKDSEATGTGVGLFVDGG